MGDLLQKNFGLYNGGKTLGGYSHDFLSSVFRPGELDAIYKTGAIARSVGLNTNPSGTAAVTGAMQDVRHPLMSAIPKAIAAKLTNAPGVNNWMMRRGVPPSPPGLPFLRSLGTAALSQQDQDQR